MKDLLENIYRDYYVQRCGGADGPEVKQLWQEKEELEQELEQALPEEQRGQFRRYLRTVGKLNFLECCEEFTDGVRLGGRLVIEMMGN